MDESAFIKKIMDDRQAAIDKFKFAVQNVLGDASTPSFSYTIGLTESFNHPELILIGLHPQVAHSILNRAGTMIREGNRFSDMSRINTIIENYPVAFRNVPSPTKQAWARGDATRYPDGFELLQMFYPDTEGHFPWEKGANLTFHTLQSSLELPPPPSLH